MRNKKAKQLRKEAGLKTADGYQFTSYNKINVNPTTLEATYVLAPSCTRAIYQRLKKA